MLCFNKIQQLFVCVGLWCNPILNIGAIKATDEMPGGGQRQPFRNLFSRALISGRCQCDTGDAGKFLGQHAQLKVVGPEIVPPLGDAVSLVYGKQRQGRVMQQLNGSRLNQPFRRAIEQVQLAGRQGVFGGTGLFEIHGGIQERRSHSKLA